MYSGKLKILLINCLCVLIAGSFTDLAAQGISSSSDIIDTIENSRAHDAFWSLQVMDESGQILEGYNYEKLVRPASNFKLISTAAIVDELGPDFRYVTCMYGLGYQKGNTWFGDIFIRGSGDPTISGEFYDGDKWHVFEKFYSVLDSLGIERIDGNLIGNDAYFDNEPYPEGWDWEDLSFYYGVEISALSFNNNAVDLIVTANGGIGRKPEIQWFPFDTDYVDFVNEQVITPPESDYDEFYRRLMGTNTILLRSKVPQNYVEKESLSVYNASMFFIDTFEKYLEDGGITVTGRTFIDSRRQDWPEDQYEVLAVHKSVTLDKIIKQINQESNNFYAEMLLKTAAAERFNIAGSTELGLSVIRDFAHNMNIDTTKLEMSDASGLASSTLLRTEDLSKFLVKMQHEPEFEVFKNSLSAAGINGSLKYRFQSSPLKGKTWAKTGYMSGVRALSGYMNAASGKTLIFCIFTNNYTERTSYIDFIHETILSKLHYKY